MTGFDPALIRIDRARLHNARARDAPRLTRALDQLTPASIGMNSRATLIVHRLKLQTPLARSGPPDRFIARLRDDLRARIVSARRGHARAGEDLFFEDEVDLELAIVIAWLDTGTRHSNGPWTQAIDAGTPLTRWRRQILSDCQLLPRVIARLVEAAIAERWLAHFEPAEIRAAATQLLRAYDALPAPIDTASPAGVETPHTRASEPDLTSPTLYDIARIAPETRKIVRTDVRHLVALALTIVRRPTIVGTTNFAEALDRLLKVGPPTCTASIKSRTLKFNAPTEALASAAMGISKAAPKRKSRPSTPAPINDSVTKSPGQSPKSSARGSAASVPATLATVHSAYGGLFFLLNSFLALKLYGDFTRPGDGLKGLSPFELMHMLGQRWFGADFASDPVEPLLIQLAGLKPGEKPGRLFEPTIWSVPDDWLLPWPDTLPQRLGFALSDEPARSATPAARRRRWVNNLARFLAARLKRALDDCDAVAITCKQPGGITLERDHLNVHFPLADHPISLRFAGLDRDPGWVPAAAHFIEFSFT